MADNRGEVPGVQVRTLVQMTMALVAAMLVTLPAVPAVAVPLPDTSDNGEWWFSALRIPAVWGLGGQGQGVTVAVLDTGVNPRVAGMSSVVLPGVDLTGSGDGRTDRDPNGSGHGTRMAAFIAGQGGAGGAIGIAPGVKILPAIVSSGSGDLTALYANGIRWAVDHRARVISLSQAVAGIPAAPCPSQLQDAVQYAIGRGAVVVAGAGNDGATANEVMYPAACRGVLAVGAVDGDRRAWLKTERQSYVDVAAPGVHMLATDSEGGRGYSNGTSNATALTSASIALVWSKLPNLTNRQVVARLLASVVDDAGQPGKDDATGYGIIRPYHAIVDNIPADAPNPVFDELAQPSGGGSVSPGSQAQDSGSCGAAAQPRVNGAAATTPLSGGCVQATGGSWWQGEPTLVVIALIALIALLGLVIGVARSRRRSVSGQRWPQQAPRQGGWPPR